MIRFGFSRRAKGLSRADLDEIRTLLGDGSIVLVGLMGCGKSAIGRRLAAALKLPFVDADEEIEKAAGKSISEIFEDHGEAEFRDGERKVIARLLEGGPQVLATGGGAFMDPATRQSVRDRGISVWLKADLPVLMKRVSRRDNRPLLRKGNATETMARLIRERYPTYGSAEIIAESREVPHDQIVSEIVGKLLEYGRGKPS